MFRSNRFDSNKPKMDQENIKWIQLREYYILWLCRTKYHRSQSNVTHEFYDKRLCMQKNVMYSTYA